MKCPRCGIINPPEAQRCDCGYDFMTKEVRTPFLRVQKEERSQGLGVLTTLAFVVCLAIFSTIAAYALFIALWVW